MKTTFLFTALSLLLLLAPRPFFAQPTSDFPPPTSDLDTLPATLLFSNLAAGLIRPGQWEINFFNSLATQKFSTSQDPDKVLRATSLQQIVQLWHNPFRTERLNIGLDVRFGHQLTDAMEDRSPLRVFGSGDDFSTADHALTALGLAARVIPIGTLPELNLQASVLIPVAGDETTRSRLGWDRTTALLQAVFYQQFQPWLYVFVQAGGIAQFKNDDRRQTTYTFPAGLYLVGELSRQRWYVFPSLHYASSYNDTFGGGLRRVNTQWLAGLGVQYYPTTALTLSLQWQKLLHQGPESVATVLDTGSFNGISLGARYVFGGP